MGLSRHHLRKAALAPEVYWPGSRGNFLGDLDEVVMASLDQAFSRRFVDLGKGEGRVLADVEKGPLHAGGELLKVCAGEETTGHWVLPPQSA